MLRLGLKQHCAVANCVQIKL